MAGEILQDHHGFVQPSDRLHHPAIKDTSVKESKEGKQRIRPTNVGKDGF